MRFPFLLLVPGSLAGYTIVCRDGRGSDRIEAAIQEAIKMAGNARDKIGDLTHDTTAAAFNPLFEASDVGQLTSLYDSVVNIATNALQVTFYCEAIFVDWSEPFQRWIDTAFTYTAKDGSTKSVSLFRVGTDHSKKPGASGSSFTTLGYKQDLPNGDVADFSNQAHIMVSKKRWDPPANDGLDHRPLDTVNQDGLLDGYTALDQLKPLSETVFHELMHAVGGTVAPNLGRKKIIDDPIRPSVLGKIYGYQQCVRVNHARHTFANLLKDGPLQRADCPTILAKALFLQIKGMPTYWSTGDVDRDTLQPAGIPPPLGAAKLRRTGIMWYFVVGSSPHSYDKLLQEIPVEMQTYLNKRSGLQYTSLMMLGSLYIYRGFIAFATIIGDITTAATATRLVEAQQCPVSPKPTCSDDNCLGSISVCATQYLCSNESPFTTTDGQSVILAGCRCCPLSIEVWCHDHKCGAPDETRICTAEELQGCACMTGKDRLASIEAAAAADDYVWRSDDSVDLDLEPSSDEEEMVVSTTASTRQYTVMATMEPLQLSPLEDIWGVGELRYKAKAARLAS
ncbi:hypothetical protein EV127DRAFT_471569 [Xylaria flabelliformis]|nr:hypothetical protein EV127DRAFT_471569 [Xylaria flabelliformis]